MTTLNIKVVANGKGRKESLNFDGLVISLRGEELGTKFGVTSETYNGDFAASNRIAGKVIAKYNIVNAAK